MEYDLRTAEGLHQALAALSDEKYRVFNQRLIPGGRQMLGVRMPQLRALARSVTAGDWQSFLENCPDQYHEDRLLRAMVIGSAPCGEEERLALVWDFVPMIDNWAVCDCFCGGLKEARKRQAEYYALACGFAGSGQEYEMRFAAVLLLCHFVNDAYIDRVLELYGRMAHEGYYLKMAVAWGLSVCYVHYPQKTLALLQSGRLDDFTHNKTIQKCRESLRVSKTDKAMLQTLRRKPGAATPGAAAR